MSFTKVLEKINEVKPFALEEVDSGPVETLTARRGRQRNAAQELKRLREEYAQNMLRTAVFVLVTGSERDEFARIATEKFDLFQADPESFYNNLADRVHPSLYEGKEGVASLFDILSRHLEDVAIEMNVLEYPGLSFKAEYNRVINSKEDFLEIIKTAINEQVGGELVGVHAIRSLVDKAIDKSYSKTVTPIVLNVKEEKFALELMDALKRISNQVFLVNAGKNSKNLKSVRGTMMVKEPTEESVEQTLKTIIE